MAPPDTHPEIRPDSYVAKLEAEIYWMLRILQLDTAAVTRVLTRARGKEGFIALVQGVLDNSIAII